MTRTRLLGSVSEIPYFVTKRCAVYNKNKKKLADALFASVIKKMALNAFCRKTVLFTLGKKTINEIFKDRAIHNIDR